MTSREAYTQIKGILAKGGVEDAAFEANAMIKAVCGRTRFELDQIGQADLESLRNLAHRRAQRQPLQYLLGSWPFLDVEIAVGPGVLIPRPETEQVCLAATEYIRGLHLPKVLDLCSGSGAIALGLQNLVSGACITAVEWDAAAFEWLQRNVDRYGEAHGGAAHPAAVRADALAFWKTLAPGGLDLIVCNPPYVTQAEYEALEPELYHEPKRALVPAGGEGDGLLFYREIAARYKPALAPGGALVFEIGAEQGAAVADILVQNGYGEVAVRQDMAGLDRVAVAAVECSWGRNTPPPAWNA